MTLRDEDFELLYNFIQSGYGIDLSRKKELITSRLSSLLPAQGYTDFAPYIRDIISGRRPDLVDSLISKLTTNYTYFLRETDHFDYLVTTVLPQLAQKHRHDRSLAIWSAGCSSGEEPYTLSMYIKEFFGDEAANWDTRILATDLSPEILEKARSPIYHEENLAALPRRWKTKYFRILSRGQYAEDGTLIAPPTYTVSRELRDNVVFRPFNLMDPIRFKSRFDLIVCRNVMIYFDQPTKDALVRRFYEASLPGGYLFVGHSDGVTRLNCPYLYRQPAIFQREHLTEASYARQTIMRR